MEKRYIYFQIETHYGEYKETISIANAVDHDPATPFEPMHIADEYAQGYYNADGDNLPDEIDTGIYEFNAGDVTVEALHAHEISQEIFDLLTKLNDRADTTDFTKVAINREYNVPEELYVDHLNQLFSDDDIYTEHQHLITCDADHELARDGQYGTLLRKNNYKDFKTAFNEWTDQCNKPA